MGRWEEIMNDIPTDNSKIDWFSGCKDCIFADDDGIGQGYKNYTCSMYADGKPVGFDDGTARCPYFEKE